MNKEIKKLIDETIHNHSLVKINDQLYLKKFQIEILDLYHIDYRKCSSVSEILFLIEDAITNGEVEDEEALEEVSLSLQEFNYYHNTNK